MLLTSVVFFFIEQDNDWIKSGFPIALLNVLRDCNKSIVIFFAYIPDRINHLSVGRIKFICITIQVIRICNQLCFKDNI